jgi:hypothetical protein
MKRTILFLIGATSMIGLLASAACSSKDDGGGGSGNTGNTTTTHTGTGGAGGCGCYSCGAYIIACTQGCPAGSPLDLVCSGSLPTMVTLNDCICDPARGNCATECAATCSVEVGGGGGTGGAISSGGGMGGLDSGSGGDSPGCMACQGNAATGICSAEFNACAALTTCSN